jgi:hypothetical protein
LDLVIHDPGHLVDVIGLLDKQVVLVRKLAVVAFKVPGEWLFVYITKPIFDSADVWGSATTGAD